MLKIIRILLGSIIAFISFVTRGSKLKRSYEQQQLVEKELSSLSLYQFNLCPFCIKTRRVLHKLNLPIELRDAKNNPKWREELLQQGGKIQVPCLRIDDGAIVKWMYESSDINQYLTSRFAAVK